MDKILDDIFQKTGNFLNLEKEKKESGEFPIKFNARYEIDDLYKLAAHNDIEDLYNRVEVRQLKLALYPDYSPFVGVSLSDYLIIKDRLNCDKILISLRDFYDDSKYYKDMPGKLFYTLEINNKLGYEYCEVDKDLFDEMIDKYKNKQE